MVEPTTLINIEHDLFTPIESTPYMAPIEERSASTNCAILPHLHSLSKDIYKD